jgi:hypothetical protein
MGLAEGVFRFRTRSCSFTIVCLSIKTMGVPNPYLKAKERWQGQSFASLISSYLNTQVHRYVCSNKADRCHPAVLACPAS